MVFKSALEVDHALEVDRREIGPLFSHFSVLSPPTSSSRLSSAWAPLIVPSPPPTSPPPLFLLGSSSCLLAEQDWRIWHGGAELATRDWWSETVTGKAVLAERGWQNETG